MEGGKGVAIDDEGGSDGGKEESLGRKLRRGATAGKKGGLCTPVPTWKLGEPRPSDAEAGEPKRSSVSARKLGANLWEIQDLMPVSAMSRRGARVRRDGDGKALDDGPHRLALDHEDRPQSSGSLRRHVAAALVKHHKFNERNSRALQPISPASYSSSMEFAAISQAVTPSSSVDLKGKFGEAGYSLKTSTELLKVLNGIWSLEEQHTSHVSLVKALKVELEHAQARIQELMQEQHAYRHVMDDLMKQVAEDKRIRKNKEQQKIKAAVQSMRDELEDERRLRRRSESLHRKLGKELSEVNAGYMKAMKNLERERKTNILLEDLCDGFAKGITDYEQEVRDLKQKSLKDCDHKVDRLVLHISEAWLDERVQMNIAEAQGGLAEKTTVTDRLRSEIDSFLRSRRSSAFRNGCLYRNDEKKESNMRRQSLESVHLNGVASAPHDADDADDSVASDMHCFELNVSARRNGNHDQLKQNNQNGIGNLDSKRTSSLPGAKTGCSGTTENSSDLHVEYDEQLNKTKLCGKKMQLLDRVQVVRSPADAEPAGVEVDDIEVNRSQKSDYCHSQENGQAMKLRWTRLHGSKHMISSSVKNLSEISECCPVDRGNYHGQESLSYLPWQAQFASVDGDTASGDIRQITSPVQNWKYQQNSPDLDAPESSSRLSQGAKENTLKAKLLEARLEGKHTRLRTLKRPSITRTRQRD